MNLPIAIIITVLSYSFFLLDPSKKSFEKFAVIHLPRLRIFCAKHESFTLRSHIESLLIQLRATNRTRNFVGLERWVDSVGFKQACLRKKMFVHTLLCVMMVFLPPPSLSATKRERSDTWVKHNLIYFNQENIVTHIICHRTYGI